MLRTRIIVASMVFTAAFASRTAAQAPWPAELWADSLGRAIERASMAGDVRGLHAADSLAARLLQDRPTDPLLLHYAAYSLYRAATLRRESPGSPPADSASSYPAAERALRTAAAAGQYPETPALLAIVIARQIQGNPFRAIVLGRRAGGALDEALRQGPENPRVWLLRGVYALHAPRLFGGGAQRAEEYLLHAITLFDSDRPARGAPAWGRAEAYAWLGEVYRRRNAVDLARAAYAKALQIQPGYAWVEKRLLPALESAS